MPPAETIDLTLALADIFSGDIDFNTDLQPGDHFELLVEKQYRDQASTGDDESKEQVFAGYGAIVAAEFENDGRRFSAVRYTADGGEPAYFRRARHLDAALLPEVAAQVQSGRHVGVFASRLHPVVNEYRAHLGVDYRAPAGSPVVAVANGTVVGRRHERRIGPYGPPSPCERLRDDVSPSVVDRGEERRTSARAT